MGEFPESRSYKVFRVKDREEVALMPDTGMQRFGSSRPRKMLPGPWRIPEES